ncbi:MAG: hypothetical protein MUP76_08985 [Acidimicrobiia bacterium]|nr:hypothetical protein [Acidimicrobiia bacterium]
MAIHRDEACRSGPMAPLRPGKWWIIVVAAVLLTGVAGCGDDGGGTTTDSVAATDAPPTTYLITRTGIWSGSVEAVGDSAGTITFAVVETDASTHEVLAEGQVVVYDFAVEDLEVVLDLAGYECPSGDVTGEIRASIAGAIPIDTGSNFAASGAEMTIEGSTYGGAMGTVTVVVDEAGCVYGAVAWVAETP